MKKKPVFYIQSIIAFTVCLILFCQYPLMAQTGNDADRKGVLPNQMIDTRSLSMAGTTIADVYGRSSIGINTALSGFYNKPSFIQLNSNHNWDSNLMQHSMTLPTLFLGPHHITARFGLLHQGFEELPFASSSSLLEPDITLYRAEVAYAIAITDHFSLGTLQSVSYTTTSEEAQYWNYFADVGLAYAPDGPVSYGMVFRGLGNETTYEIIETGQTTLDSRLAGQVLEIGATLRYPIEDRSYVSISFANEKRFGEEGLWYKGGIEIIPTSYVDIKGGAMVQFDQSIFIPRVGLGINISVVQLDYMISPKSLDGEQFHQVGLTIQF